jgi:hypothetical protein
MKFKFLDKIMVKSKLRRTETILCGACNRKEWVMDRFKHPKQGVVIGWRTLSNGELEYYSDEPTMYHPKSHFKALLVVLNEKQNPIYVMPSEAFVKAEPKEDMFSQSEITKTYA